MKRTKKPNRQIKKRIKPASAKAKGRALQKWTAQKISELTGYEWGSSGEDKPIESRPMGQSGTDIRMESQVKKLFPFDIECKAHENWSVHSWVDQARKNETSTGTWMIIARRSRQKPVVIMEANAFFELLEKIDFEG